jgi:hypothetical protein
MMVIYRKIISSATWSDDCWQFRNPVVTHKDAEFLESLNTDEKCKVTLTNEHQYRFVEFLARKSVGRIENTLLYIIWQNSYLIIN